MRRAAFPAFLLLVAATGCAGQPRETLPTYGPVDGTVTSASTTVAPVAGVADASRRRLCPTVEKLLLLDTGGNQDRVSAVVAASRDLVEEARSLAPDPLVDAMDLWAQARIAGLDLITEADYVVDDVDLDDPRWVALTGPAVVPIDELLAAYCDPDSRDIGDVPEAARFPGVLLPDLATFDQATPNGLVVRSLGELDDLVDAYTALFDVPQRVEEGWEFTGTYAGERYRIVVGDEGLGSRVAITALT
ncbi:MAG TPA: hypothetical protein VGC47_02480 [Acidimicrobiia bacterium]|jgi:hypothetical protein